MGVGFWLDDGGLGRGGGNRGDVPIIRDLRQSVVGGLGREL